MGPKLLSTFHESKNKSPWLCFFLQLTLVSLLWWTTASISSAPPASASFSPLKWFLTRWPVVTLSLKLVVLKSHLSWLHRGFSATSLKKNYSLLLSQHLFLFCNSFLFIGISWMITCLNIYLQVPVDCHVCFGWISPMVWVDRVVFPYVRNSTFPLFTQHPTQTVSSLFFAISFSFPFWKLHTLHSLCLETSLPTFAFRSQHKYLSSWESCLTTWSPPC